MRQGEGPGSQAILAYQTQAQPDKASLSLTTQDGTRIERSVALDGDAIRFEITLTAGAARPFDAYVHSEYDAATLSDDPNVVGLYVKAPEWVQANKDWKEATPTDEQTALIKNAASGGAFAYYNHEARFGVEQRFNPDDYSSMGHFWSPSRLQVNLELFPKIRLLEKGQQARYAYEVRYLNEPPTRR